jgi:hypothetical protein
MTITTEASLLIKGTELSARLKAAATNFRLGV